MIHWLRNQASVLRSQLLREWIFSHIRRAETWSYHFRDQISLLELTGCISRLFSLCPCCWRFYKKLNSASTQHSITWTMNFVKICYNEALDMTNISWLIRECEADALLIYSITTFIPWQCMTVGQRDHVILTYKHTDRQWWCNAMQ